MADADQEPAAGDQRPRTIPQDAGPSEDAPAGGLAGSSAAERRVAAGAAPCGPAGTDASGGTEELGCTPEESARDAPGRPVRRAPDCAADGARSSSGASPAPAHSLSAPAAGSGVLSAAQGREAMALYFESAGRCVPGSAHADPATASPLGLGSAESPLAGACWAWPMQIFLRPLISFRVRLKRAGQCTMARGKNASHGALCHTYVP